jgi:hypothetical protein
MMYSASTLAISCPEHARLESEFVEARDRMRGLVRLRNVSPAEERQLAVRVAMAIARLKELSPSTVANARAKEAGECPERKMA